MLLNIFKTKDFRIWNDYASNFIS